MSINQFCKKCGHSTPYNIEKEKNCPICNSMYIQVEGFLLKRKLNNMSGNERADYLQNKYGFTVKPEWEQKRKEWYEKARKEWERERQQEADRIKQIKEQMRKVAEERGSRLSSGRTNTIKCPYCGSNNVSRIGVVERSVSVGVMGLASSKIGKTHKCGSCGSTW